ncbi:MAG: branched-chain amino acid ABC transporter substrate-binding protein, partial [Candidatus Eremiobacteraeota bacterium]|nr:branched-chain amino acid ABC transporter substrate-binding protein [Candidatus Eremiobacteraeota bacterium]
MKLGALLLAAAVVATAVAMPLSGVAGAPVVKLGLDLPLSGIDGASAIPARNAVVLAVEAANGRGFPGGGTVVLDDLDDAVQGKHDPAQGAQNVRAFAGDPEVLAAIGPMNSNVAKAEIPISNAAGLAQITMAATAVELTRGPDAARLRRAGSSGPTFFRVCASDDRQGAAAAAFAYGRGLRRAFVIDDDESYGKGLADVFASEFPKDGGTLLGREHLTAFALDYKALLTKIAAERPDMIFFGGIVSTGGAILRKQMADVGLAGLPYFGGDGLSSPEFVPLAGPAADDTYFTLISPDIGRLPAARAFVSAYRKRFGSAPGTY